MNRSFLLGYQLLIGLSDTATGSLLIVVPAATLGLMRLHAPTDALPFVSYIGAFVFSVGLSCLYGAVLMARDWNVCRLETVWLLTAFARASVAVFIVAALVAHTLETGWLTIAVFDGACVIFQGIGLRKGWLRHVAE
jgi:hypothetical protein